MRKGAGVVVLVCLLLGCAGILLATGSLRGWLVLAAGGSTFALLLSRGTPDRVVTILIGIYVLLTGVSAGLPKVWVPTPSWVQVVAEVSFWGSLSAMVSTAWFARARLGARRPTSA
jgi:hypothetical protein